MKTSGSPDEMPMRRWLEEADALAAQGKYAEAIHHLLFRSIEDISSRRPNLVRPALTSREIAASEAIPSRAGELFASIARLVERSLFGGRAVGRGRLGRSARRLHRFCARQGLARMSEIAIGSAEASDGPFKRGAMLLIVAIGTLAFIAMLVLGAYAPDLRSGRNGGSHALSNAATGYSGLVRLAQETGRNPRIVRSEAELKTEDLVVITPEHGWTDLSEILALRGPRANSHRPSEMGDDAGQGQARLGPSARAAAADRPGADACSILSLGGHPNEVAARAPRLRAIRGRRWMCSSSRRRWSNDQQSEDQAAGYGFVGPDPARPGGEQSAVFARRPRSPQQSRHGGRAPGQSRARNARFSQHDRRRARSGSTSRRTAWGVRKARSSWPSIRRFLAVTLTIFAAMLLAAIQALTRFGSPRRTRAGDRFGKAALVDNSAALIRKAGREGASGRPLCRGDPRARQRLVPPAARRSTRRL